MTLTVLDILKATKGHLVSGDPHTICERISIDTRTLRPGDVFFALRGPRFDGHRFVATALQRKAAAVVVEHLDPKLKVDPEAIGEIVEVPDTLKALQDTARYARSRATKARVIGLTGSNGKTTTKEMLASILRRAGKTLATRGNLNNQIGLPLMLCELETDHRFAVLELGTSKKGDMNLLADLSRPDVALITNVGKDHLEFLGTPEGVLKENQKIFEALPPDGIAIINLEDPLLKGFAEQLSCATITYGYSKEADVSASHIVPSPAPLRFTLKLGKEMHPVTLGAIGEIQVWNAMAAAAVAYALKISSQDIVDGLAAFKPSAMRMEEYRRADSTVVINDAYNANPSSMRASIESFCRSFPDRPRWVVLGDMRELGEISRDEHKALGRWLSTMPLERIYLYGRDTRFIQQGLSAQKYRGVVERFRKKRYLIEALTKSLDGTAKPALLLKASRRLQLEQVSHALSSLPS